MSIVQALKHENAAFFMDAFAQEINSLNEMKTFIEYFGNPADIPKGSLLSSKAIFSMIYNADGTFKKFKARFVAHGDMLKNLFDPDTYAGMFVLTLFACYYHLRLNTTSTLLATILKLLFCTPT